MNATIQRHDAGLTWTEPAGMMRSAHALVDDGQVWLIDPFEDEAALAAAAELGRPAAVIQLLDRHNRDCAAVARRLGIGHLKVPTAVPDSPFAVTSVVARRWWREAALWWPQRQTLVIAEALGSAPLFAVGRPLGVHPLLRLTPPRGPLAQSGVQRILVGHGAPVSDGAQAALDGALGASRSDVGRLLIRLPGALRGA